MAPLRLTLLALAALSLLAAPTAGAAEPEDDAGSAPLEERIINGHSPSRAWPAQASVRFNGSFICGGSLVSARWVVTAGHCADVIGNYSVRVGASRVNTADGQLVNVDQRILHENFASNAGVSVNDVALLHLISPVPFEPLMLVSTSETALWAPGVRQTIIGWGATENSNGVNDLREAEAPIVADATCSAAYGSAFDSGRMVCAGDGSTDTCQGDSGGPLLAPRQGDFVLAGITSWGAGCADPDFPGVYTRVGAPALNQWIRDRIPTVTMTASPGSVEPGGQVLFTATRTRPASQPGEATFTWDLDGDGQFDDASGNTAGRVYNEAGTTAVRVQTTYPDGDRAVAREVVTVATPPPPPPTPPPPPAAPVTPTVPPQGVAPTTRPLVTVRSNIRLATLRSNGVRTRVRCSGLCAITARLTLNGRTARRFGLTRGSAAVTIGRATARLDAAGARIVRVRLSARARRALRRLRSATIVLRADVLTGAVRARETRNIAVRR